MEPFIYTVILFFGISLVFFYYVPNEVRKNKKMDFIFIFISVCFSGLIIKQVFFDFLDSSIKDNDYIDNTFFYFEHKKRTSDINFFEITKNKDVNLFCDNVLKLKALNEEELNKYKSTFSSEKLINIFINLKEEKIKIKDLKIKSFNYKTEDSMQKKSLKKIYNENIFKDNKLFDYFIFNIINNKITDKKNCIQDLSIKDKNK